MTRPKVSSNIAIMTKFAVIQTGGKQYRVSEGETIYVEKLSSLINPIKDGDTVIFDQVLLTDDGANVQIGVPYLTGAKIEGVLVSEKKGKKVMGIKYKAKSNYRVKYGHRQIQAKVKISKIV